MRESRTSGSGRGDQGNPVPYRHRVSPVAERQSEGRLTEPTAAAQCWRHAPIPDLARRRRCLWIAPLREGRMPALLKLSG